MLAEYPEATVRTAEPLDGMVLAANLRAEDLREIRALRKEPLDALCIEAIAKSKPCYTAFNAYGQLALVFGVTPHPTEHRTGIVWLLGTPAMESISYRFIRESRTWLNRLFSDRYDILFNIADKRNELHLQWLRWLGFKFIAEVKAGFNREPFIEFYISNDVFTSSASTSNTRC